MANTIQSQFDHISPDLLLHSLSFLPITASIQARRVNSRFKSIVDASQACQQLQDLSQQIYSLVVELFYSVHVEDIKRAHKNNSILVTRTPYIYLIPRAQIVEVGYIRDDQKECSLIENYCSVAVEAIPLFDDYSDQATGLKVSKIRLRDNVRFQSWKIYDIFTCASKIAAQILQNYTISLETCSHTTETSESTNRNSSPHLLFCHEDLQLKGCKPLNPCISIFSHPISPQELLWELKRQLLSISTFLSDQEAIGGLIEFDLLQRVRCYITEAESALETALECSNYPIIEMHQRAMKAYEKAVENYKKSQLTLLEWPQATHVESSLEDTDCLHQVELLSTNYKSEFSTQQHGWRTISLHMQECSWNKCWRLLQIIEQELIKGLYLD